MKIPRDTSWRTYLNPEEKGRLAELETIIAADKARKHETLGERRRIQMRCMQRQLRAALRSA